MCVLRVTTTTTDPRHEDTAKEKDEAHAFLIKHHIIPAAFWPFSIWQQHAFRKLNYLVQAGTTTILV
jgi:hypothetical protein